MTIANSETRNSGVQMAFSTQLVQVRLERRRGGGTQHRDRVDRSVVPGALEDLVVCARARLERGQDLALALKPVLDVVRDPPARVPHDRAVARADSLQVQREQPLECGEVCRKPAAVGGNENAALP